MSVGLLLQTCFASALAYTPTRLRMQQRRSHSSFSASTFVAICRTLWLEPKHNVRKLELKQLKTLRSMRESLQRGELTDRAILTFDLDADLRGVFNWNVKQLFIYITAKYQTNTNEFNEVVIWDRIVNKTEDAEIVLSNAFNEYPIIDQRTELRGAPITLALNWDVMPITGLLYKVALSTSTVRMPTQYCTEQECKPEPLQLKDFQRPGSDGSNTAFGVDAAGQQQQQTEKKSGFGKRKAKKNA